MKVLMIGPGRDVKGGISTVVNQYYAAGLDKKVELKYIATMEDGSRLKKLLVAIKAYIDFCLCVKGFDVIHVHMASRASFYRKSYFIKKAYAYGKKIIIHMHGAEFHIFYAKECDDKTKRYVKHIFNKANRVIALSEEWKDRLSTIYNSDNIEVVYNSVKIPDFERYNYSDHSVLFLGRLDNRKGIYDLLKAIPEVIKTIPDVHFYLGGDGDIQQVKQIIEDHGLSSNVTYLGWVIGQKKDEMLRKCSVFVLPSYNEGMPMSLLEAMSYGCVVVSTNVGGIPKVLHDGQNGYMIEAGDVEALALALKNALAGESREELSRNARMSIENSFDIDKNVLKIMSIYSECVSCIP